MMRRISTVFPKGCYLEQPLADISNAQVQKKLK